MPLLLTKIGKRIKKLSKSLLPTIADVITVLSFIAGLVGLLIPLNQWVRGDQTTLAFIFIILILIFLFVLENYWRTARYSSRKVNVKGKYKYSYKVRITSKYLLLVNVFVIILFTGIFITHAIQMESKTIILITNLDSPDQATRWALTRTVKDQLDLNLFSYPEIAVLRVQDHFIDAIPSGSEAARALGILYFADIVIWGEYATNDNSYYPSFHIEYLGQSEHTILDKSTLFGVPGDINDLNNFTFQPKVADDLSSLLLYITGMTLYETGEYEGAQERFLRTIAYGPWPKGVLPDIDIVLFYSGNTFLALNDYEHALEAYAICLEANPDRLEARMSRSYVYMKNENYIMAKEDLDYIIIFLAEMEKNKPLTEAENVFYASVLDNRGNALRHLDKQELAIIDYDNAISRNPNIAFYYYNRCVAHQELGHVMLALDDCDRAVRMNDRDPVAWYNRANTYILLGDITHAIEDYTHALAIDPFYTNARINRAATFLNDHQFTKAILDYSFIIDQLPRPAGICLECLYINRGDAYFAIGKKEEAMKDYQAILSIPNAEQKIVEQAQRSLAMLNN